MVYELFTDGSHRIKQHRIGWGIVVMNDNVIIDTICKDEKMYNMLPLPNKCITGSTRVELMAIVDAIRYCIKHEVDDAIIYNDNEGLISMFDRRLFYEWNSECSICRHPNHDLWKAVIDMWDSRTMRIKSFTNDIEIFHELAHFLSQQNINQIKDISRVRWLRENFDIVNNCLWGIK